MVNARVVDARPHVDDLIELDTYLYEFMLVVPSTQQMADHGLAVYRELGEASKLWIGLKDLTVPDHCRWLFYTSYLNTPVSSWWLSCEPEDRSNLPDGEINIHTELNRLWTVAMDTNRYLTLTGDPVRNPAWLLTYRQVFGESNAVRISLMPENPNWLALHEIIYHTDAWRSAHDAADVPVELLLRMHGMGPFMDHEYGRALIHGLLDHDA